MWIDSAITVFTAHAQFRGVVVETWKVQGDLEGFYVLPIGSEHAQ